MLHDRPPQPNFNVLRVVVQRNRILMLCAAEVRGVLLPPAEDPAIESRCHHRFHLQVRCGICSGQLRGVNGRRPDLQAVCGAAHRNAAPMAMLTWLLNQSATCFQLQQDCSIREMGAGVFLLRKINFAFCSCYGLLHGLLPRHLTGVCWSRVPPLKASDRHC